MRQRAIAARSMLAAERLGNALLNLVLPPRCLACGVVVALPHTLCGGCWSRLAFLVEPLCRVCGQPFAAVTEPGTTCAACVYPHRAFHRVRAAVAYDDGSKRLILALKHGDRTDIVPAFAGWMAKAGAGLLEDADLLVPVPLHWTRLWTRRYNQAALLARATGSLSGRPVDCRLLVRGKRTPPLGTSGPAARAETVRGAFAVPKTLQSRIAARRVLLVDDVFTTGSTAEQCALTLLRAGAASVDVLALARVVRPVHPGGSGTAAAPVRH